MRVLYEGENVARMAMSDKRRQATPGRRRSMFPKLWHGASIESLEVFAERGKECLASFNGPADARLDSIQTTRYRLAGNAPMSASDVEANYAGDFGCGLRVSDRHGVGFAVGKEAFSWSALLSAAMEHAMESSRVAEKLPTFAEDERDGQNAYPALTEMTTPTQRWFAGVHEELRARPKRVGC